MNLLSRGTQITSSKPARVQLVNRPGSFIEQVNSESPAQQVQQ